jgi:acyl carrier protein
MRETIEDVLRGMIAKQAHLDPSVITPESVLSELGMTSLDLVEIIMTIEDKYDVTIPVDEGEASCGVPLANRRSSANGLSALHKVTIGSVGWPARSSSTSGAAAC